MTKFTLLALALAGTLTMMGCSTASKPGCCGSMEGNLCGWNFYKPADLVEGQAVHCPDLCAEPQPCAPGIRFTQEVVAAPSAAAVSGDSLAAPVVAETPDDTAEFGLPADTR